MFRLLIIPLLSILIAVLACGTVVTQTPYYVCPTAVPTPFIPPPTPLPGTPRPLPTPFPIPPTPYVITPPQDFHIGDAVIVGQSSEPLRLRFRLLGTQSRLALSGRQNLYTWQLEIRSVGSATYETIPVALMAITRVETAYGTETGTWHTSEAAMREAGYTSENYDALMPDTTRVYRLAAYAPIGSISQMAYTLDADSGNRITWMNSTNPTCNSNTAD